MSKVNDLVCHVIASLNENAQVNKNLRQEISEKFQENLTYEEVNSFVYLNKVIKETMRLFPLNPLLGNFW